MSRLGNGGEESSPATPMSVGHSPGRRLGRIALEVVLISIGVFLALLGKQWREHVEHDAQAQASLRRLQAEFVANRSAVAAVKDRHAADLQSIQTYNNADAATQKRLAWPFTGLHPAFLEYSAWDLALATQSLSCIDPGIAQSIARVYAVQRQLDDLTRDMTQVMYMRTGDPNPRALLGAVAVYFGDCTMIEPRLLALYDETLTRLAAALGNAATPRGDRP